MSVFFPGTYFRVKILLKPSLQYLQLLRKVFSGCYAVGVFSGWAALTTPVMTRWDDRMRIEPYLGLGALVLFAVVAVAAAWTTWRDKPSARVWGVLASLLIGSFFLSTHLFAIYRCVRPASGSWCYPGWA